MNTTSRHHLILLGFSAVCMAITSTAFSILGAINLFTGIQLLAGIAATSLELGKFSAAAHIHSHWNQLNGFSRFYLSLTLGLLMLISSGEIFFQLSSGFAESSAKQAGTAAILNEWKIERDAAVDQLKGELDRISKIGSPYLQRLARTSAEAETAQLEMQIKDLNTKIGDGIAASTTFRLSSGPVTLLAEALGYSIATTQTAVVALFTAVFDPLAVVLVMLFFKALENRNDGNIVRRTSRRTARVAKAKRRKSNGESVLVPSIQSSSLEEPLRSGF